MTTDKVKEAYKKPEDKPEDNKPKRTLVFAIEEFAEYDPKQGAFVIGERCVNKFVYKNGE